MKTVALDAMGGDHAPLVEIEGAVDAARTGEVRVILVGDRAPLEKLLARRDRTRGLPIEIRHASQVITMHDHPSVAVRRRADSSMRVAAGLVRSGDADAVVSAGNSGALLACGLLVLGRVKGVDRPAISTTFPTIASSEGRVVILDVGANVECRPLHLVQFAVMGAAFARGMHGKARPRVGLLANGVEEHKGTDLTREANRLLREGCGAAGRIDYVGYVEGRDLCGGGVDVVVCDGFTGNLLLKVTEGVGETLAAFLAEAIRRSWASRLLALGLLPAFRSVRRRMDYAEQGGAPLLGVKGVAIVCHGGSNRVAIKNAILQAARLVDARLGVAVEEELSAHRALVEAARGHGGVEPEKRAAGRGEGAGPP
jgi:phosphate acyltransferase